MMNPKIRNRSAAISQDFDNCMLCDTHKLFISFVHIFGSCPLKCNRQFKALFLTGVSWRQLRSILTTPVSRFVDHYCMLGQCIFVSQRYGDELCVFSLAFW